MSRRIKNWFVTIPVREAGLDHSKLLGPEDIEKVDFAVWQEEKGVASTAENPQGYRHIQLYIEFAKPHTFEQAKEFLGADAHIEIPKKVRAACILYCQKEETRVSGPWTFGDVNQKQQGKRNDLDEIQGYLDAGGDIKEVEKRWFGQWCRYSKSFNAYHANLCGTRRDGITSPHVIVVWGDAGSGKSRWAFMRDSYAYWKMPGNRNSQSWYDRYQGQSTIVFDDFTDDQLSLAEFCRLCDPYPMLAQTKGSTVDIRATEIIFTSNVRPEEWWQSRNSEEMLPQVNRRVDHVVNLKKKHDGEWESVCFSPCKKCCGSNGPSVPTEQNLVPLIDLTDEQIQEAIDLTDDVCNEQLKLN